MEFKTVCLKDLFSWAEDHKLVLPNFQRDFVWKTEAQQQLLASFIIDLPIGNFLLLKGDNNAFISNELCFNRKANPKSECYYLLDGQQRLSTVKNIFNSHLHNGKWQENFGHLHFKLKNIWYIDLEPNGPASEFFGYDSLCFNNFANDLKEKIPKLSRIEPLDIIDSLKFFPIHKEKNKEKYYHPECDFKGKSDYDIQLEIGFNFAHEDKIPLFDLLTSNKNIIRTCLKHLAEKKVDSLKGIVDDDPSKSINYLGHLDTSIENKYSNKSKFEKEINQIWNQLKETWIEDFFEYFKDLFKKEFLAPTVASNELSRATSIFEYMNKGGTPLDTFDIMVAKYVEIGKDNSTLYDRLKNKLEEEIQIQSALSTEDKAISYSPSFFNVFDNSIVSKPVKELFLNYLSIVNGIFEGKVSFGEKDVSLIKKEKILNLKRGQIENSLNDALKALVRSIAFIQFRCGVPSFNSISYNLMLLPIGIVLIDDANWENPFTLNKIEFWYWTSLFSGRFREKQNVRSITEIGMLKNWIEGGEGVEITTRMDQMFKETNYCDLDTLLLKSEDKSVPNSIHNGLLQFILSQKPNDFVEEDKKLKVWELSKNGTKLNDHHIIPLGSSVNLGQSSKEIRKKKDNILNSPLNRTLITSKANAKISDMTVEKYLPLLSKAASYSHFIANEDYKTISFDDSYYKKFANSRYTLLTSQLLNELSQLKG
jgi:hypothetical protein